MKIIVFGASSKTSIGFYVGEYLKKLGHTVVYASRSGGLGEKCDINEYRQVYALLNEYKPDVIVNAAGVFTGLELIGQLKDFSIIKDSVFVKCYGSLLLADISVKLGVNTLIVIGGHTEPCDSGFFIYNMVNNAMLSLVKSIVKQTRALEAYYLEIPAIKNSSMVKEAMERESAKSLDAHDAVDVCKIVEDVINGKYESGSRIRI
ncbi:MAG: hypothetical protein R3B60_00410 [Candidatus Paceibacterota bacterium]